MKWGWLWHLLLYHRPRPEDEWEAFMQREYRCRDCGKVRNAGVHTSPGM